MTFVQIPPKTVKRYGVLLMALICHFTVAAQMRQVYLDNLLPGNEILKLSFYAPNEGFVAARNWIGYTADSGRSFTKQAITLSNVNYNGYSVNLTFGFGIAGIKAFNQNDILVYGDYGLVPAILYSNNGGVNYTLIYHSQFNAFQLSGGITDMVFPENNSVGFAVDNDRILKTTNGGLNWSPVLVDPNSGFEYVEAVDNNNVFAFSTVFGANKLVKTTNGGSNWQTMAIPGGSSNQLKYVHFLTASTGWLNKVGNSGSSDGFLYKTIDGGSNWLLQNNATATPIRCDKMKFLDANTGYALSGNNSVSKTVNGGGLWEPLPRDNSVTFSGYSHNDLQILNGNQLWAGSGYGFLELNTNLAGPTLPKAYFNIDTTGLDATGNVNLLNYSKTGYTYQWFLNNVLIGNSFNAVYTHNIFRTLDTIKLVVSNGVQTDSTIKYQSFHPPVIINSFTPTSAAAGTTIAIKGRNFTGATAVSFGGVPAANAFLQSDTTIFATVGNGASGSVRVFTNTGSGSLAGFIFISPPTITAFNPTAAGSGTTVTITGTHFTGATAVTFGGVAAISFTVVSPSTITAVVPSGPSGAVSVTTPGGTASLAGFTALHAISSFSPASGTQGTVITILGSAFTGATGVSIGGVPALSFTVNNANTITAVVGAGASGNVTVTKPTGSSSSLSNFTWYAPPVISTFAPASGPVGTTVTITGTGFDAVPNNNTVYFGAVKAMVTGSSATSLTVTVPAGASFDAIKVTTNNLVAYSAYPFVVTFANGGSITDSSFATRAFLSTEPDDFPSNVIMADMDDDGKNDLIVSHRSSNAINNGVLLYRNTSSLGTVAFAPPFRIALYDNSGAAVDDLDGDGKLDLLVIKDNDVIVYKNNSTPGSFLLAQAATLNCFSTPGGIAIKDLDGDGKADVAVSRDGRVFRNISNPGSIAFAASVSFPVSNRGLILLTDFDGDGKPDMVMSASDQRSFAVQRNICTKGSIAFGPVQTFPGFSYATMAAGDIDNDGKTDLVSSDYNGSTMAVIRNTSTTGNINFAQDIIFPASYNPGGLNLSDLDGDGKLDIAVTLSNANTGVFKNASTPGNIIIESKSDFVFGTYPLLRRLALGDVDGDGKNDIVTVAETQKLISVHLNKVKAEPFIRSFSPTQAAMDTTVTITGVNFTGVTAVSFGGVPATSFVVNSSANITAVVGSGASGNVSITNALGTSTRAGFVYGATPIINGFTPITGPVGSVVTITGNNFGATPSSNTVYFGGAKAKVTAASSTTLTVEVPFGSMQSQITVATGGRIAFSSNHFVTSFAGGLPAFTAASFAPRLSISIPMGALCDVDGDGKLDFVGAFNSNLVVSSNTSNPGNISFAAGVNFPAIENGGIVHMEDLDGDGQNDAILLAANSMVSVMRNTSLPGRPSFGAKTDYSTFSGTSSPSAVAAGDLDGDGKAEVLVTNASAFNVSIFKNNSSLGNLAFAPKVDYSLPGNGGQIILRDMDGDGKLDMINTANSSTVHFSIYRNTSVTGTISFAPWQSFGTTPSNITLSDIDGDGKLDVIGVKTGIISVYRNISTPGNIAFATKVDFPAGSTSFLMGVSTNDMDGDGKVDLLVNVYSLNKVSVYKNSSTPGNVILSGNTDYATAENAFNTMSADLDADGKPDMVVIASFGNVFRNTIGGSGPGMLSFSPLSAGTGDTVRITASNFANLSQVSFGGTPAIAFGIEDENTIWAVVGAGTSGEVVLTTSAGIGSLPGFIFGTQPVISSVAPSLAIPGSAVAINGANLGNITSVGFGGVPASSFVINSPTLITAVVGAGASGNVTVSGANGTASFTGITIVQPPVITSFTPLSTGSGATVTINGANFTGATAVSFGEVPVSSFTVVSPSVITAVVGGGATGSVKVTTPGGVASMPGYTFLSSASLTSFYPTSATTGTTVIIQGFNLGIVTNVFFGGVAASSFTLLSPSSIAAVVAGGASGSITATTQYGTIAITGFTFVPPNTPSLISFAPVVAGPGTKVNIIGLNFTGATAVSFGGVAASSFTVNSPTSITATVGSGAAGNVVVTSPGGTATLPGFQFTTAPLITGCFPNKANPGTQVVLKGSNFAATPAANTVYFGAVKATVVAATTTSLTVVVPKGATHAPITVAVNSLIGYTQKAFVPVFSPLAPLSAKSFVVRVDSVSVDRPRHVAITDINGDGRPDLGIVNQGINGVQSVRNVTIYPNNSSAGKIALQPRVYQNHPYSSTKSNYADLNGDGKLDMVVSNDGSSGISIYRNVSSGGATAFDSPQLFAGSINSSVAAAADFDMDGKTDIAVITGFAGPVSVYRNISTGTAISLGPQLSLANVTSASDVATDDIDGDGRPDILVAANNGLAILRNTSSLGTISFASPLTYNSVTNNNLSIATGDLDDDGKVDVAMVSGYSNVVSVYRNRSEWGNILMERRADFVCNNNLNTVAIGDMDGDGKLDIVTGGSTNNFVTILRNKSSIGVIAFEPKIDYVSGGLPYSVALGDIDGDDKPDIVAANFVSNSISVLRNLLAAKPAAVTLCANGGTGLVSNIGGPTYQWQVNTGAGFVNISDNVNYTGTNTASLQLSNVPSTWYGYQYRCSVNGLYSNKFTLRFTNYWTGAVNNVWENPGNWSCGVVPDANTDVIINSGTIVLGSNALIRTLQLAPEVSFTVGSGFALTVLQ